MRCKWKEVRSQQNLVKVCDRYGRWFLEFSDYSLTMILHEVCGFGQAKRLPDLFDSINPLLNAQMRAYMEDDEEDLWEVTQTTYFGLLDKIRSITEWNPEKVVSEYPVKDLYRPIIGDQRETDRHIFRQNFTQTMEKKIGVYWYMVLLYLHDKHGFGAVRLERVFRRIREEYVCFAELFLKNSAAAEKDLHRMVDKLKKKAAGIGIQYDYGDGPVPVRKDAKNAGSKRNDGKTGIQDSGMVRQNVYTDVHELRGLPGMPAWDEHKREKGFDSLRNFSVEIPGRSGKAG